MTREEGRDARDPCIGKLSVLYIPNLGGKGFVGCQYNLLYPNGKFWLIFPSFSIFIYCENLYSLKYKRVVFWIVQCVPYLENKVGSETVYKLLYKFGKRPK